MKSALLLVALLPASASAFTLEQFMSAPFCDGLVAATPAGEIVGHVAFSPVLIDGVECGWYGLGPLAVLPEWRQRGIGAALVEAGLERLRRIDARGCVVLGDPTYYSRFGFAHDPALSYPGPPPEYFQRLLLDGDPPAGVVTYSSAFG